MPVKVLVEQGWPQVVVVVVTKVHLNFSVVFLTACVSLLLGVNANAAVLPEDRADVLYHSYDGGGVTVDGPSVLVRKKVGESVSVSGNYYVDSVSSASIDVQLVSGASRYSEERTQTSVGVDYLYDKSTMSFSTTTSSENDYDADTTSLGMTQDMFGGLTTISMSYTWGDNIVRRNGDPTFSDFAKTKDYRLSLTQVLTRNLIMGAAYEIITDEGFLNNPYRSVRYLDGVTFTLQPEKYPRTRTSNAVAVNFRYYLPYRAALHGGYRYFTDTWDIKADTFEVGYTHPYEEHWTFDVDFRLYNQSNADFYSDLFPYINAQNYLARDKELSTFTSYSIGLGAAYEFTQEDLGVFDKGSLNFYYNYFIFDYADFRDATQSSYPVGQEPLYNFSASVIRLYLSLWF